MARIAISDLYLGEGPGEKYGGIMSAVVREVSNKGIPEGCDERAWIELPIVKHTFLTAMKMAEQGDVVSELAEAASPFCIGEQKAEASSGDAAQRHGCHPKKEFSPPVRPETVYTIL